MTTIVVLKGEKVFVHPISKTGNKPCAWLLLLVKRLESIMSGLIWDTRLV